MLFWLLKWISIAALATVALFIVTWVAWVRIRQVLELRRIRAELGIRTARTATPMTMSSPGALGWPFRIIGRWLTSWHGWCELLIGATIILTIVTIANPGPAFVTEVIDQAVNSASQSHTVQTISDAWNYVIYSGHPPADAVLPRSPSPKPTWFWGWCAIVSWILLILVFIVGFGADCVRIIKEQFANARDAYERHEKDRAEERKLQATPTVATAQQAQGERGKKGKQPAPEPPSQAPAKNEPWWRNNQLVLAALMDVGFELFEHYRRSRKGRFA